MPPIVDPKLCIHCGECWKICEGDVFYGSKEGEVPVVTYPEECWHEWSCVQVCPVKGAVRIRTPLPMMLSYK